MSFKQGLISHLVRNRWRRIKQRCYNKNNSSYENYGGRGISMYPPWQVDFLMFYEYVISLPNYDKESLGRKGDLTLDRINNDGNYEPGNLRWTDSHNQSINRRIQKNNKTGYIGVSFVKSRQRYRASIKIYDTLYCFGNYNIPEEAVIARDQYIIDHNLVEYPLQILTGEVKY